MEGSCHFPLLVFTWLYIWSAEICEAAPSPLQTFPYNQIEHIDQLLELVKAEQEKHVVKNLKIIYYSKDKPTVPLTKCEVEGMDLTGKKIVVYTHGYQIFTVKDIKDVAAIDIKDAILQTQKDVGLVMVANWISCAVGSLGLDYPDVAINVVPLVANEISKIIIWMFEEKGVDPSNLELVGHSLGAQISGQVCKTFYKETGKKCSKITGLDPAGPWFKSDDRAPFRLAKEDANFVMTINTDTTFGYYGDLGDHNEYPDVGPLCGCYYNSFCQHGAAKDVYMMKLKGQRLSELKACKRPSKKTSLERDLAVIFVIDASATMKEHGRFESVKRATKNIISSIPLNSSVGIVLFGATAEKTLSPILIKSESSRQTALAAIPNEANLGATSTSIGAGIQAAVGMMTSKEMECAEIIVISSREENQPPYLKDVYNSIPSCSKINSIGLGNTSSKGLEELSKRMRGKVSSVSDHNSAAKLLKTQWDSTYDLFLPRNRPIRLPLKELDVEGLKILSHDFVIDEGMNQNIHWLLIHPDYARLKPSLTSPSGIEYGEDEFMWVMWNQKLHGIELRMEEAEVGVWKLNLKNKEDGKRRKREVGLEPLVVFVSSEPKNDSIVIDAKLTSYTLDYTMPGNVSIIAKLSKGDDMIIRADVKAIITSPENENDVIIIDLRDDGAGADEFKDDGVYSRFLSEPLPVLQGGLRYEVNVIAKGGETGRVRRRLGRRPPFNRLSENVVEGMKKTNQFEREITAGSVRPINNYIEPAPAPIKDLRVTYVDIAGKTVTLSWTATGLKLDTGTALSNNLTASLTDTCSTSPRSQLFPLNDEVFISEGSLQPLPAGTLQKVTVKIPESLWWDSLLKLKDTEDSFPILYFRIRAEGNAGKFSKFSNIGSTEQFLLGLSPDGGNRLVPNSFILSFSIVVISTLYFN